MGGKYTATFGLAPLRRDHLPIHRMYKPWKDIFKRLLNSVATGGHIPFCGYEGQRGEVHELTL